MFRSFHRRLPHVALLLLSACGLARCAAEPADQATIDRLYSAPAPVTEAGQRVFFIGHSLIGKDMPAMLAQLAPEGHGYESQLGWGAELQAHWEPDVPLAGGEVENAHPRFREAREAVASGDYDVLVVTEKIGLQASIEYHESWRYLALWAESAWAANPDTRVYLYETWHETDVAEGWLARIDGDLGALWEREIVDRALTETGAERPIYVIPAGQVLAAFVRRLDAEGGVGGLASRADLFDDSIHVNDLGDYLVALTHYAVIYGRSPVGLPYELVLADGSPAAAPGPEAARLMQEVVWDVVTSYPRSGVRAPG
ncbi:MAG: hypothetical protein HKN98_15000 [Silicimonas sp.]|nr:hypothetical protein [Silicimonas sp.]